MKNFKSSESRDGGRDRRDGGSFGKREGGRDNFRNDNFSKGGFGGKSFGNRGGDFKKHTNNRGSAFGSDRGEVVMSKATCSECSNVCEVPFKPNGERPVFCSNCFMSKRDGTFEKKDERRGNTRENDRRERRDSYSTPSTNVSSGANSSVEMSDLKKQIANLNTKIDSLANVVDKFMVSQASAPVLSAKSPEVKTVVKEVAKKVTKVAAPKTEVKETVKKVVAKREIIKAAPTKTVAKKVAAPKVAVKAVAKKVATKTVTTKKEVAKKVQASKVATGLAKKK